MSPAGNAGTAVAAEPALPSAAYVAALAGFRNMNVHRLAALLRHHTPEEAWLVALGELPCSGLISRVLAHDDVRATWRRCALERPPAQVWQRCIDLGVQVLPYGHAGYPAGLLDDPLPPPVLFARGDLGLLSGRRVAIVGTRNATAAGRDAALRVVRAAVLQTRNHPAVITHSVANELSTHPDSRPGTRDFLADARALTTDLNPTLPTSVDVLSYPGLRRQKAYGAFDMLGLNTYFGWYPGKDGHSTAELSTLVPFVKGMRAWYPKTALVMTEFGAEATTTGPDDQQQTYAFQQRYINETPNPASSLPPAELFVDSFPTGADPGHRRAAGGQTRCGRTLADPGAPDRAGQRPGWRHIQRAGYRHRHHRYRLRQRHPNRCADRRANNLQSAPLRLHPRRWVQHYDPCKPSDRPGWRSYRNGRRLHVGI